jgi:exodeoxyribonuclease VII large subunit
LRFQPENGMKVLATGRVTVFPRDGQYQLYCTSLTPDGVGDLHVAFEQLKQKLYAEGLFDQSAKQPLPRYPHRIAIITSSAGAAVRDMLRILGKRYPLSKVVLLPVRVQGEQAPAEIAGAIRYANAHQLADVIITGRGGGSIEDLWAFNDERVARAIYASEIPVVSAVGHEPDVTISDFVADVRAATPSNGAEIVAPDQAELRVTLQHLQSRMTEALLRQLKLTKTHLAQLQASRALTDPTHLIQEKRQQLDSVQQQMCAAYAALIHQKQQRFVRSSTALDALSPLKVLGRGFSLVRDESGAIVKRASDVQVGQTVQITLHEGSVSAVVRETREGTT